MSRFAKAWAGDQARGAIILLISVVIGLPIACAGIAAAVVLGNLLYEMGMDSAMPWILIGGSLLCSGALLALMGGVFAWTLSRRKRWLDAVFAPLGLKGSSYMLTGQRCQGMLDGRHVDVRFVKGPMLTLYVSTPLATRLAVAEQDAVIGGFLGQALDTGDPDYASFTVYPRDPRWARALLADPEAKAALLRLMNASQWALIHQVILEQGQWFLRLYRNKSLFQYAIAPEEARQWFDDLLTLVRVGESLPPPQT